MNTYWTYWTNDPCDNRPDVWSLDAIRSLVWWAFLTKPRDRSTDIACQALNRLAAAVMGCRIWQSRVRISAAATLHRVNSAFQPIRGRLWWTVAYAAGLRLKQRVVEEIWSNICWLSTVWNRGEHVEAAASNYEQFGVAPIASSQTTFVKLQRYKWSKVKIQVH